MARELIDSGSTFEREIGYSRAVVDGDWIFVSGTTGFDYVTMTIADDVVAQTEQCLRNIEAVHAQAVATWSVVAVDRSTGRVVIASATCVDQNDDFLKGVQAVVVPGKGVAACQAAVDNTHANQMVVFQELQKGTDPKAIIEILSKDPAFQSRQFGIVDLMGRRAGHSGLTNGYVSQDIQGQVLGTEIFYSIQGNILRPGQVVPNAVEAFLSTSGAMTDRVMAAMDAADGSGGDSRGTGR